MKRKVLPIIFFALITFLLFWKFFIQGLLPFPGNYMLAWFEPWKTDNYIDGTISIVHKPIAEDLFRQGSPFKALTMDYFKSGQLPLWNPYNGGGMPFLANLNMGYLHPTNLLFLFFPYGVSWAMGIVLEFFLIGLFTYLYARKIGLRIISAFFSASVFLFSGFVTVRLIFSTLGYSMFVLPCALYLLESYIQNPRTKLILLLPPVIAIIIFSTQPQIALYIFLFLVLYAIFRFYQMRLQLSRFIFIAFCFSIGIAISSIQLMPTLELYRYANLTTLSSVFIFERFLLSPFQFISLFIPNYFGSPSTYNYWGGVDYIQTAMSIGIIPLLFLFISIFLPSKDKKYQGLRWFFVIAVIITFLLTVDWFFSRFITSLPIPFISTGIPTRIFILTSFSIAMLAGIGVDKFIILKTFNRRLLIILALFVVAVCTISILTVALFLFKTPCPTDLIINCRVVALRNTILEIGVFAITLSMGLAYLSLRKSGKAVISLPILILTVFVLSGLYNSIKFQPFSAPETFLPSHPLITAIQQHAGMERIFGIGEANIATNFATGYKFYDPNYYHPLYIKRYGELVSYGNTGDKTISLLRSDVEITRDAELDEIFSQKRERLFELLSVSYLIYKKDEVPMEKDIDAIWQDNNWHIVKTPALPRAYLVNKFFVEKNDEKILARLFSSDFNPYEYVLLEKGTYMKYTKAEVSGQAYIKEDIGNELTIEANVKDDAILVLTDNFYPGWRAYVDGKETEIIRANYAFRAIYLPKGVHTVKFIYAPNSFKYGAYVTLLGIIILLGLYIFYSKIKYGKN